MKDLNQPAPINRLFTLILLAKLEYYGVCGATNDRFKSYLVDRRKFVCINGFNSDHALLKYGFSQGSLLGAIIFLILRPNL